MPRLCLLGDNMKGVLTVYTDGHCIFYGLGITKEFKSENSFYNWYQRCYKYRYMGLIVEKFKKEGDV